jgi:DNA uptake protein ComE-like DNA-binding protein
MSQELTTLVDVAVPDVTVRNVTVPDSLRSIQSLNTSKVQQEINRLLNSRPSLADKVGWVYGFASPKDRDSQYADNFWIKIGRTERPDPWIRTDEWGGELLFCYKSSFNHRLERLIHLFFDYARETRIGISDHKQIIRPSYKKLNVSTLCCMFSCWVRKNDTIKVKDCGLKPNKEIEWFHFQQPTDCMMLTGMIARLVDTIYSGYQPNVEQKSASPLLKSIDNLHDSGSLSDSLLSDNNLSDNYLSDSTRATNPLNDNPSNDNPSNDNPSNDNPSNDNPSNDNHLVKSLAIKKKVNINTAPKHELMTLYGIKDVISTDIIKYRENKKFLSTYEICKVHPRLIKSFEKIKNDICI